MAEATKERMEGPRLKWFAVAAIAVVLVGVGFYVRRLWVQWPLDGLEWAELGDAIAPFTGLVTAFALFAALWSVHLQRRDLQATIDEMREQRRVSEAQHTQMERTAKAQEDLAAAQRLLANAQSDANRLAESRYEAERFATVVAIRKALIDIDIAIQTCSDYGVQTAVRERLQKPRERLRRMLNDPSLDTLTDGSGEKTE